MKRFIFFCVLLLAISFVLGCHSSGTKGQLVVVLMGDPQMDMTKNSLSYVKIAMDDLTTVEYDFIAVLGDLLQGSTVTSSRRLLRRQRQAARTCDCRVMKMITINSISGSN